MDALLPNLPPTTKPKPHARAAGVDADVIRLCTADDTCETFLDILRAEPDPGNAIRFVAASLDQLTVLEWACERVKAVEPADPWDPDPASIFDMVDRWLAKPNEPLRQRAMQRGEDGGYQNAPEYLLGVITYSGGSIAPPEFAEVPPPEGIYARMAAGAAIAASFEDPDFETRLRESLDSILEYAQRAPKKLVIDGTDPELNKPAGKPEPNIKSMLSSSHGEASVKDDPKAKPAPPGPGEGPKSLIPRRTGRL